jgi:glycosyltransferase involved in cell wall biosynthesis
MTKIVWLINNLTHYHRARADSFANRWPGEFVVLELSGRERLSVLRSDTCVVAQLRTLFPGRTASDLEPVKVSESVRRYLDESRPDVCCLNGWALPGNAAMLDWAVARGVPCAVMSESNKHDHKRHWLMERVKSRFVSQCSSALVGGTESRRYLIDLGMAPAAIFDGYDAIDNEHFRAGAEAARWERVHFQAQLELPDDYFFACARFEPKKNFRRLIEAYSQFALAVGSGAWKLVIAGDGPSRSELEGCARDLRVEDGVIFVGLKTYQELPALYGLARAFIHASTTEQWGLVVNEAMAAGLAVLVSRWCGCAPDLVRDGYNGFTFDPWDVRDITQKMLTLYRDSTLCEVMGRRSAYIISEWGPERFTRGLKSAVDFALNRGPVKETLVSRAVVRLMAATSKS